METVTFNHSADVDPAALAVEIAGFCDGAPQIEVSAGRVAITAERIRDFVGLSAAVQAHRTEASSEFGRLEDRARQVWRGEATFTPAQAQKILAGLVLRELDR